MKNKITIILSSIFFRFFHGNTFSTKLKIFKKIYAFTVIELIVSITIIVILGTIAFLGLQGYSTSARNSTRLSDLSRIKSGLELYSVTVGGYPDPTNGVGITYSGGTAWVQGTMGDDVIKKLSNLNKTPKDPLVGNEYTYSLLNTKLEYQLGAIQEIGFGRNENKIIASSYASEKTALATVVGNYNGQILKVSTGGTDYILSVPSIINSDISDKDLLSIINKQQLSYNNYGNLPSSYTGKGYTMTGGFNYGGGSLNPLLYAGNTTTLISSGTLQVVFVDNLKNAYSGSQLISDLNIQQILSTTSSVEKQNLVANMVNNKVSGLVGQISLQSLPINGCSIQPSYSGATFTVGSPTMENQMWQSTNSLNPCYWTCGLGNVLVGNNCVSENCAGTTPNGTSSISNATSTAGGTWNYNTTAGLCTYTCNSGYTWNGSSCVANNCIAGSYIKNTHSYSVPAINHGLTSNVTSTAVAVTNGTQTFTMTYGCSAGIVTENSTEGANAPVCNSYYSLVGGNCTANSWISGSYGSCSVSCGGGTQSRSVTCQKSDGTVIADANCSGVKPSTSQSCNTQSCAVNCSYTTYQGGCSASCGGGQYYTYYTKTVVESGGGTCPISEGQFAGWGASCNTQACPTSGPYSYGAWGSCSATCGGGTQTRTQSCNYDSCYSPQATSQSCNTQACPTSGPYSYGAWGSCNASCGGGTQTRTQSCNYDSCYSPQATSQSCNTQACGSCVGGSVTLPISGGGTRTASLSNATNGQTVTPSVTSYTNQYQQSCSPTVVAQPSDTYKCGNNPNYTKCIAGSACPSASSPFQYKSESYYCNGTTPMVMCQYNGSSSSDTFTCNNGVRQ